MERLKVNAIKLHIGDCDNLHSSMERLKARMIKFAGLSQLVFTFQYGEIKSAQDLNAGQYS